LKGIWKIDDAPEGNPYTGYFRRGKKGLVIARYSTCCTECRRGTVSVACLDWQTLPDDRSG